MKKTFSIVLAIGFIVLIGVSVMQRSKTPELGETKELDIPNSGVSKNANIDRPMIEGLADNIKQINGFYQQLQKKQHSMNVQQEKMANTIKELSDRFSLLNQHRENTSAKSHIDSPSIMSEADLSKLYLYTYDAEFVNQEADPSWSTAAEHDIAQVFYQTELRHSSLLSSVCKSSVCKLEMRHENDTDMNDFMEIFPSSLGWKFGSHMQILDTSDGITTVMYLSRDGKALPAIKN